MNTLTTQGYIVLPVFDTDELTKVSTTFLNTAMKSPELTNDIEHTRFVLGGVGYVPFASLWYSEIVRYITKTIYKKTMKQNPFEIGENEYFSMLPDRPFVRFPIQAVDEKGKLHQDDATNSVVGIDNIYGGWINLNTDVTQYFKAIPGTHNPQHPIFEKLQQKNGEKRGYSNFKENSDQKCLANHWKNEVKQLIEIPPGHILIFQENLIHTVYPNPPINKPILRLHTSFLISTSNVPLNDIPTQPKFRKRRKIVDLFQDQELVPVRSGQNTPLYSPFNLFPNNIGAVNELSRHYINVCKKNDRVLRFLPSMKTISKNSTVQMLPPMSQDDMRFYLPHKVSET